VRRTKIFNGADFPGKFRLGRQAVAGLREQGALEVFMERTTQADAPSGVETVASPAEPEAYPNPAYAWFVVGLLTLAYVFSFIDRQILTLMVTPITKDLGINDTQMGLLMGASFAVFYTFFGIPLGRLADTRSRRVLIACGIGLWSLMTAGCGLTRRFWQLALMRMGVGVGEASLSPAAYSLISDYFPPHRRATAISVYSMGIYIGSGLAFILGGMVIQFASGSESIIVPLLGAVRSWQMVFFVVGLPGLFVALLMLIIREPSRKGLRKSQAAATFGEVWSYFRANMSSLFFLNTGVALITLFGYGAFSWTPSFFIRRFDWTPGQTGLVFGLIVGFSGTLGIVSGGRLADWLRSRGRADADLRVALLSALVAIPFVVAFPLAGSGAFAAVLLTPVTFLCSVPFGVAPAAIQQMMPNTMRSQASALYLFVINLIGMGIGPWLVAWLTDYAFRDPKAVGYSLLAVGLASFSLGGLLIWLGLRPYRRSLEYLKEWTADKSSFDEV
jgi:MFS family permease